MLKNRNISGYVPFVDTPLSGERYLEQDPDEPGYIDPYKLYADQIYETMRQAELTFSHDETTERMLRDKDVFYVLVDIERLARDLAGYNDWDEDRTYIRDLGYIKHPEVFMELHYGMEDDPDVKAIAKELERLHRRYYGVLSKYI